MIPKKKWNTIYFDTNFVPMSKSFTIVKPDPILSVSLSVRVSGRSSVLQVFSRGSWRTVCSEAWDSHLGSVACRQLGYNRYKQLQCTIRQLYSSGISGHKKNLAPQRSKSRKKRIEYMYSNTDSEQIFIRPYGLKYRMHKLFFYFWSSGLLTFSDFCDWAPSLSFLSAGCVQFLSFFVWYIWCNDKAACF